MLAAAGPDPTVQGMALELLDAGKGTGDAERAIAEARVLLAQGLVGPAIARLDGLKAGDPGQEADGWALRGYALKLMGKEDQAEEAARWSLQVEPDDALGEFVLGSLLAGRGDPRDAVPLLQGVVDKDPGNPAYYLELAGALVDLGDYGDAQRAMELASRAAPDSPEVRLAVARFYVDRQYRVEDGLEAAREAVRLTHNSPEALGTEAWALHLLGRTQEAVSPAEQAVAGEPESALLRYRLGSIHEALGQRERAREQYRMVEELDGQGKLRRRAQAALAELDGAN
jgi:tetratricopeptide (TPR) repeat protein